MTAVTSAVTCHINYFHLVMNSGTSLPTYFGRGWCVCGLQSISDANAIDP
jgi:hypothetical protein